MRKYTKDGIRRRFYEVVQARGPDVTLAEFTRRTGISQGTIVRWFGGWTQLRVLAGLPAVAKRKPWGQQHDPEEVVGRLRAMAEEGRDPRIHEFIEATGVGQGFIYRVFGSWGELRERAGLPKRRTRDRRGAYTENDLLKSLLALVEMLGQDVTQRQFRERTGIPDTAVRRLFGSWRDLREAAGLPRHVRREPRITDEELLADFHRVVVELHTIPRLEVYDRHGRFSAGTLRTRFGGRRGVIHSFRAYLEERARREGREDLLGGGG